MRILITGTNKGLGLEFVRQYLERGEQVIAACRNPQSADSLHLLQDQHGASLTIVQLDVIDRDERAEVFEKVNLKFTGIDLLINNAGIRSGGPGNSYVLGELHAEDISRVFEVNSIGPLLMVEDFLELLAKGQDPKVINISSRLGSIGSKTSVYRYSYCASKSALNMFSKMLAIQLESRGIAVLALHPGHVQTDLGGYNAPLVPEQSIRSMIRMIDAFTIENTGKFLDWQGRELPW